MSKRNENSDDKDEFEDFKDFHIAVMIEWDGKPPRQTWYDYLHFKMGIWVRGGNRKEYPSPLARREALGAAKGHRNGVVLQEGLYLCRSEDIAKQLAYKARELGAGTLIRARVFMDDFTLHEEDVRILDGIHQVESRKGRKKLEEAGRYTITCLYELTSFEVELNAIPTRCPSCSGYHFYTSAGRQKVYALPKSWGDIDLYGYWVASRFSEDGKFSIPKLTKGKGKLPPETAYQYAEPKLFLPPILKPTPFEMLKLWDCCYALGMYSHDDRRDARLDVVSKHLNSGGERMPMMAAPKGGFDLVDLCILMYKELSEYL